MGALHEAGGTLVLMGVCALFAWLLARATGLPWVTLLLAAFVEAFWSSTQSIPAWIKFSVAGLLWLAVLGWLWRGGHGRAAEDADAA